jgi:hypothetical protein
VKLDGKYLLSSSGDTLTTEEMTLGYKHLRGGKRPELGEGPPPSSNVPFLGISRQKWRRASTYQADPTTV